MRQGSKVVLNSTELQGLDKLLESIPPLVRAEGGPLDRAVSKAGTVIKRRAVQLAPDSRETGSREKQTAAARRTWSKKLRTTITKKTVRFSNIALAIVGPRSPDGNMAHFMQEKKRNLVAWGRRTGWRIGLVRDWIVQAFDETKGEQLSAMEQSLRDDIDKVMRGQR